MQRFSLRDGIKTTVEDKSSARSTDPPVRKSLSRTQEGWSIKGTVSLDLQRPNCDMAVQKYTQILQRSHKGSASVQTIDVLSVSFCRIFM